MHLCCTRFIRVTTHLFYTVCTNHGGTKPENTVKIEGATEEADAKE